MVRSVAAVHLINDSRPIDQWKRRLQCVVQENGGISPWGEIDLGDRDGGHRHALRTRLGAPKA